MTAYELRISDWSSDVCSSDLLAGVGAVVGVDPLLCPCLYDVAQAQNAAEYRDRRRGGGLSAADRLGCRDGERCADAGVAVPVDLPVDPATFLGARAVRAIRLCRRRHPDDAGRGGRATAAAAQTLHFPPHLHAYGR